MSTLPRARTRDLVVTQADSDHVVYDIAAHVLHTIPAEIARVWVLADGNRTSRNIALRAGLSPAQVEAALAQLAAAHLLDLENYVPATSRTSRRRLLRNSGVSAASLGVAITSVTAAFASGAASCPGGPLGYSETCIPTNNCCGPTLSCTLLGGQYICT